MKKIMLATLFLSSGLFATTDNNKLKELSGAAQHTTVSMENSAGYEADSEARTKRIILGEPQHTLTSGKHRQEHIIAGTLIAVAMVYFIFCRMYRDGTEPIVEQ